MNLQSGMARQSALKDLLVLLWLVRSANSEELVFASGNFFGFLDSLCPYSGQKLISVDEWCLLFVLERNAFQSAFADSFPLIASPITSPVPAPADALPSPAVGPELPELEQVPALTEVVAHVEPLQVPTPAPRGELWLLCVLVEPRSSALGFQPGRFATVTTVRRLPPLLDRLARWNYDQSKWMVCANSIYVPCAANGLYLRQTPVLRFFEVLERVRQRTTSAAATTVLAANQQRRQAGAVRADGHNARSVRAGVMA